MIQLRPYQEKSVILTKRYYENNLNNNKNGIIVLPTGSGKSVVIANIIKELNVPTLVLQPQKEILIQNFKKYTDYGYPATIYSASVGQKVLGEVTFATIMSVIKIKEYLRRYKLIIVDECHTVTPESSGKYKELIEYLGVKVIGLTATPYRLCTNIFGAELRFITRQKNSAFKDIIHFVQNKELFDSGYLAELKYYPMSTEQAYDTSKLVLNSTGTDYTDASVMAYNRSINFSGRIQNAILRLLNHGRKSILVFTRFREDARAVSDLDGVGYVDGEMNQDARDSVIRSFTSGKIKVLVNVGVLTTGFDYPELDTILLARDTLSLALYYQMVGRGIRNPYYPNKKTAYIVDMCNSFKRFGRVEDLTIRFDKRNAPLVTGIVNGREKQLTNVYL